ncbi:MAG: GNAT family N-acetyltransferase [Saprospiraceae bacterium]|nr:GNAT family N-acetyltransferase [Saprospiraceae bacterium]
MKFKPRSVRLKDERSVLLRMALVENAEALRRTIQTYLISSPYVPLTPEEFTPGPQEEEAWIQGFIDQENSLLLVAEYENEIVGNIDLTGSHRMRMRHTGMIGMGLRQEWRNTGLGSHLLREMIRWAELNPILEIVWLEVYATNGAGRRIYEQAGFQQIGTVPDFFKSEGTYTDKVIMSRQV